MGLFTDDNTGADKARAELARKSIAQSGGMAIGADALAEQSEKADIKRRAEQSFFRQLTALQSLMQDPAYRAVYERVSQKLQTTQNDLDAAIIKNAEEHEHLLETAAKSKDGQPIFRREDGSFVYADGSKVSESQLPALKDIPNNPTSWIEYKKNRKRADELSRTQTEILDPIHRRMGDPENPPERQELETFERELDEAERKINQPPFIEAPQFTSNFDKGAEIGTIKLDLG